MIILHIKCSFCFFYSGEGNAYLMCHVLKYLCLVYGVVVLI